MITLKPIPKADLPKVWQIAYSQDEPDWIKTDAPFLHDYQALTWEEFKQTEIAFFTSRQVKGIYLDEQVIGAVTYYWENQQTRWLEIGISIFSDTYWSQGYGQQALQKWTTTLFKQFPYIKRVGYSTWSGNEGMIRLGEKLGYTIEGRLRKVRYYQGSYYDAIKMGVLRSEWFED